MGNNNSQFGRIKFNKKSDSNENNNKSTNLKILNELKHYNYEDIDRQHLHHFFKKYLFQSNFSSPVEERLKQGECKVLDVGCGPGTWLLDLAHEYGKSYFYGLDINPVYPNEIKPGNLEFVEANVFEGLPFPDNEFDFVHQDSLSYIIRADQWDFVISEMIRVTKPGGYIEFFETYVTFEGIGPVLSKIHEANAHTLSQRGVEMKVILELDTIIKSNQSTPKVHRADKVLIMGPNGDKIGTILQDIFVGFHNSEALIENLSRILGIPREEYISMINNDLVEELKHTRPEYMPIRYWAQKENIDNNSDNDKNDKNDNNNDIQVE